MKKRVLEYCQEQVAEGTETFNWRVYDLNQDSISDLLNTARTLPWMASRRWIYVKGADLAAEKWNQYLKDGKTDHRNWWPDLYTAACKSWGIQPNPKVLQFNTSYEAVRADLKAVSASG